MTDSQQIVHAEILGLSFCAFWLEARAERVHPQKTQAAAQIKMQDQDYVLSRTHLNFQGEKKKQAILGMI